MLRIDEYPCGCLDSCIKSDWDDWSSYVALGGAFCKKERGHKLKPKMSVLHRREFDNSHRRLQQAEIELSEAKRNLERATNEHNLAAELVNHWESVTADGGEKHD